MPIIWVSKYVVLVGARDIEVGKVTIKNMESGDQELVDMNCHISGIK